MTDKTVASITPTSAAACFFVSLDDVRRDLRTWLAEPINLDEVFDDGDDGCKVEKLIANWVQPHTNIQNAKNIAQVLGMPWRTGPSGYTIRDDIMGRMLNLDNWLYALDAGEATFCTALTRLVAVDGVTFTIHGTEGSGSDYILWAVKVVPQEALDGPVS